jgi:hypothetical protein
MTILIILIIFAVAALMLFDTKKGILAAILTRPLIDCFWEAKDIILGVRPTEINGVVLPLLILFKIIISREHKLFRSPFAIFFSIFTFYQFFPTLLMTSDEGVMQGLNYFFRSLHGFVGFLAFQEFFHERDDFKKLLLAFIIAGLAPLSMSVYQNILGGVIRTEATVGELVRNIGFYHDAYTLRYYTLQTLAGLILYGAYFVRRRQVWLRSGLIAVGLLCLFTIYRIFSKAGYLILAQWGTVWFVFKKQIFILVLVLLAGTVVLSFSRFSWIEDVKEVYGKEMGVLKGEERVERAFQGRMGGWMTALEDWRRKPLHLQLMGTGTTALGMHNDFLRVLIGTGIVGLLLYLVILAWALAKATANVLKAATSLNIMALMLLFMWLIDAMGLVPGGYPGYQIFVWGFVGLAFRGVSDLEDPQT